MSKNKMNSVQKQVSKPDRERNGKIELLRFIFALVVALFHLGGNEKFGHGMMKTGYLAVEFFFIVSGYLLVGSVERLQKAENEDIAAASLRLMKKKVLSIAYCQIPATIMIAIAWIPYFHLGFKEWLLKIMASVPSFLNLQTFGFKTASWFIPMWYISAMLISLFVLIPLLIKNSRFYSMIAAPIISLACLGFIYRHYGSYDVISDKWEGYINLGLLRAFGELSLGCTCCYIVKSGALKRFNKRILSCAGIILYLISLIFMRGDYDKSMQFTVILMLAAAITITFANDTFRFLNNKFIYFLGRISLPVYLCHPIAIYSVLSIERIKGRPTVQLCAFFTVTAVLSVICMLMGEGLKRIANSK